MKSFSYTVQEALDTTLILCCQTELVFTLHPSEVKLLTSFVFHVQIADEIFAFSYCIVSSKRYGACVIKLTNLLWLVSVLSLQCSLLAHFYPREEMGQTKEKKNLCFLTETRCNASLERCCSVCSSISSVIFEYLSTQNDWQPAPDCIFMLKKYNF